MNVVHQHIQTCAPNLLCSFFILFICNPFSVTFVSMVCVVELMK